MAEDKIVAFMQDMAGKYIPGKRTGSDVWSFSRPTRGARTACA